jgi:hypothetical protein
LARKSTNAGWIGESDQYLEKNWLRLNFRSIYGTVLQNGLVLGYHFNRKATVTVALIATYAATLPVCIRVVIHSILYNILAVLSDYKRSVYRNSERMLSRQLYFGSLVAQYPLVIGFDWT